MSEAVSARLGASSCELSSKLQVTDLSHNARMRSRARRSCAGGVLVRVRGGHEATGEEGDRIYALAVTSRGVKRACMFSQAELARCSGGEASEDTITSRVSKLVSRHSARPAAAPASAPSRHHRRRKKRQKAAEAPGPA